MRALPDRILEALLAWAMVTKDRTASDSSCGSTFKEVWSKRKRGMVLGSNFNPFASKITGLSVCHLLYDDSVMLNMVRHAIYSSLSTDIATATSTPPKLDWPRCKCLHASKKISRALYSLGHYSPGISDLLQTRFMDYKQYKLSSSSSGS